MRLDPHTFVVFDVCIPGQTAHFLSLLEVPFVDLPLLYVSLELVLPFLHVFVVE